MPLHHPPSGETNPYRTLSIPRPAKQTPIAHSQRRSCSDFTSYRFCSPLSRRSVDIRLRRCHRRRAAPDAGLRPTPRALRLKSARVFIVYAFQSTQTFATRSPVSTVTLLHLLQLKLFAAHRCCTATSLPSPVTTTGSHGAQKQWSYTGDCSTAYPITLW